MGGGSQKLTLDHRQSGDGTVGQTAQATYAKSSSGGGRKRSVTATEAWQEICTRHAKRDTFSRARAATPDRHVSVPAEAVAAMSLRQLGEVHGYEAVTQSTRGGDW